MNIGDIHFIEILIIQGQHTFYTTEGETSELNTFYCLLFLFNLVLTRFH